jgi:CheY-like chemotaxis protein
MAKVLVVDDEPDIVFLARLCLQTGGHSVLEAEDGESALKIIESESPDVVLLDLRMSPMDGWDVLERLNQTGALGSLPVIVVSAHASRDMAQKALDAGCRGYLDKPFERSELLDSVATALGESDQRADA